MNRISARTLHRNFVPSAHFSVGHRQFRGTFTRYYSDPSSPRVTPVENLDEFQKIIKKDKYTVFDFWATWCGPCKMISPIFEQLSTSAEHVNVEFYNVDVDAATDIAGEAGIRAMPTFILYKNGQKIDTLVGASPEGLKALVQKAA